MKLVLAVIAALSIAGAAALTAGSNSFAAPGSFAGAGALAKPAPLMLARYRHYYSRHRCQENLGYGRTGSYGCG